MTDQRRIRELEIELTAAWIVLIASNAVFLVLLYKHPEVTWGLRQTICKGIKRTAQSQADFWQGLAIAASQENLRLQIGSARK